MADGSGHGPEAAHAATLATRVFRDHRDLPPPALLAVIHQALASTRGAAVAAAVIERAAQCVKFAGLGNIAGTLIDGAQTRRMVSFGGTAGHTWRSVKAFTYPFITSEPI